MRIDLPELNVAREGRRCLAAFGTRRCSAHVSSCCLQFCSPKSPRLNTERDGCKKIGVMAVNVFKEAKSCSLVSVLFACIEDSSGEEYLRATYFEESSWIRLISQQARKNLITRKRYWQRTCEGLVLPGCLDLKLDCSIICLHAASKMASWINFW